MSSIDMEPGGAEGIHRCGSNHVNWYLVEEDEALTVVDTGFPTHWEQLTEHLDALDYGLGDIEACLLTHAHPDHIGFAHQLHQETSVQIWCHESAVQRAGEGGDPPLGGFVKNIWRPAIIRYFIEVVRSEGMDIPPVTEVETFAHGTELDVPGHLRVIHVPGHTEGQVAFYIPNRDVLICGDALATVNFETWRGNTPQLLPPWLNVDHAQARESLRRIESVGEVALLPGHGDPWSGELAEALRDE